MDNATFLFTHMTLKNNLKTKKNKRPVAIELFAGSGGSLLGLEMAGFNTVIANEIHPHPCLTLKKNFPHLRVVEASIIGLSCEELLKRAVFTRDELGDIDLIAGGPPCQGFSTAGLKNPTDARNNLVGEFVRMVKELKPKYFLMENVSGLTAMYGGKLFESLLKDIESIGYKCRYKVLRVAEYGVPQMRKRLIILGARDGEVPEFPEATHVDLKQIDLFNNHLKPFVTCGDALSDLPLIDQGETATEHTSDPQTEYQKVMREGAVVLTNHEASKHREETMNYYALVPPGGTWLDIPKELRKKKQGMQRLPLNGLARTITTEPTDFIHPTLNRIPTIRELARIQSYPDWFEFLGQRTTGNKMRRLGYCSQSQQVGNSVPPLFAKAIGQAIIKHLAKQTKKSTQRIKGSPTLVSDGFPAIVTQTPSLTS